jgi:hypothetical protein
MVQYHGTQIRYKPFSALPNIYRAAIDVYHGGAGASLPLSDQTFGLAIVPMSALVKSVMNDVDIEADFESWEKYHAWYLKGGRVPHYKTRWPVVLSSFEEETLEDGWHRLHSYYRDGAEEVPVIWYA